jgi:hypothetical protein
MRLYRHGEDLKSVNLTDFTLDAALGLLDPPRSKASKKNPSDLYDKAEERLINRLKKLGPADAEAAIAATIERLKATLEAMKAAP